MKGHHNTRCCTSIKACCQLLGRQRCDDAYESHSSIVDESKEITDEPALPCQRRPPRRIDAGAPAHLFNSSKAHLKKTPEVLDLVSGELKHQFQQERGMPIAA